MMIKYRVHDVAKDLDVPNKEVLDILGKYVKEPKKHMTALEENELDIVFDRFTQDHAAQNFDAYFATRNAAKTEEKPAEKTAEKPSEKTAKNTQEPKKQNVNSNNNRNKITIAATITAITETRTHSRISRSVLRRTTSRATTLRHRSPQAKLRAAAWSIPERSTSTSTSTTKSTTVWRTTR